VQDTELTEKLMSKYPTDHEPYLYS